MMTQIDRRNLLKISGTALGGLSTLPTESTAADIDRFIVDMGNVTVSDLEETDLEIVHNLPKVDITVVRGEKKELKKITQDFVPDVGAGLDLPAAHVTLEDGDFSKFGSNEQSATDEPGYFLQWDKQVLDIPSAHEITRGEGTRVAIIDTGVAAGHPDLQHAINEELSRDFTGDGLGAPGPWGGYHGTHVAGIVAANDQNERGVVGTAPATEIVDCRVFSDFGGYATLGDLLAAIVYAATIDCDVANVGVGAYPLPRQEWGERYGRLFNRVTTFTNQQGTLVVIPAGNHSADLQHDKNLLHLPTEAAQGMSISSTGPIGFRWDADEDGDVFDLVEPFDSPAFYTNYGTNVLDLGAPGGDFDPETIGTGVPWYLDKVLNTVSLPKTDDEGNPTGEVRHVYGWAAGTSMSAPQATGAAALVKSQHPNARPDKIKSILEKSASVPDGYDKNFYGSGFLAPVAAIKNNNNNSGNE